MYNIKGEHKKGKFVNNAGSAREANLTKSSQFSQYEQPVAPQKRGGSKSGGLAIRKTNISNNEPAQ